MLVHPHPLAICKNKCSSIFFPAKTVSSLVLSASAKQKVGLISLLRHLSPQVSGYLVPLQSQFFNGFKKMKICCFYSLYYKVWATTLFLSLYIPELKTLSSILIIMCATFLSLFPTTVFVRIHCAWASTEKHDNDSYFCISPPETVIQ